MGKLNKSLFFAGAWGGIVQVIIRKQCLFPLFLSTHKSDPFYPDRIGIKTNIGKESAQKRPRVVFPCSRIWVICRKTAGRVPPALTRCAKNVSLLRCFIPKTNQFAKTGSGQTYGKPLNNEMRFSQGVHAIGCSVACKLVVPLAPLAGKKPLRSL